MRKIFDPELYKANDKLAKDNVKKILKGSEYSVEESDNKMAVDLKVFKNGKHIAYIECEKKEVWKTYDFPYENVQIPERKSKFTKLDLPTFFVMFNKGCDNFLVIRDKDLLKSNVVEVANKYVPQGEKFFQVPLKKVTFGDLRSMIKSIE